MNSAIWKYPLSLVGESMVEMPKGAAVMCVQAQYNEPMIWVECNPKAPKIKRRFVIHPTGAEFDAEAGMGYVGTFQMNGGSLVFHVYTDRVEYTD